MELVIVGMKANVCLTTRQYAASAQSFSANDQVLKMSVEYPKKNNQARSINLQ